MAPAHGMRGESVGKQSSGRPLPCLLPLRARTSKGKLREKARAMESACAILSREGAMRASWTARTTAEQTSGSCIVRGGPVGREWSASQPGHRIVQGWSRESYAEPGGLSSRRRPHAWIWASEETATGVRVNFTPGGPESPVSGRGEREEGLPGAPNRRTHHREEEPPVHSATMPSLSSCRILSRGPHPPLTVGGHGIDYRLSRPAPLNPATDSVPTPCHARRAPGGRFLSFRDVLRRSA
jgi:hypothetical protein